MRKRIFSMLLALAMISGSIPLSAGTACAVDVEDHTDDPNCACELCTAKTAAKSALNTAAGENPSALVSLLVRMAKQDIDAAEDLQTISSILDETLEAIGNHVPAAHEHTFSADWSYNETHHWHESTCGHDTVTSFAAHNFDIETNDGTTVYTCACGYQKVIYDTPGSDEGEIITGIRYSGVSLTLDSSISINFYMDLTEDAAKNGEMIFTIGNRTVNGTLTSSENGSCFTCPLTALEMAETVRATFTYCGRTFIEDYSVAEYITYILECKDESGNDYSDEMKTLAKKIANYGYYVQLYLEDIHKNVTIGEGGYAPMVPFSDCDIDTEAAGRVLNDSFVASEANDNLELFGRTVSFESSTALNYYLAVKNDRPLTSDAITCNRPFEVRPYQDNIYIVSVRDIPAPALDEIITVTVNGDFTLSGSVLDYCGAVIKAHSADAEMTAKDVRAVNAMTAFYEYFIAAGKYAGLAKVSFEMNGIGEQIPDITGLAPESFISRPADPTAENYLFCGWFKDEYYENEWNFETDTVSGPTTLYARWEKLWSDRLYLNTGTFEDEITDIQIVLDNAAAPGMEYSFDMSRLGNGVYSDRGFSTAYANILMTNTLSYYFVINNEFTSSVYTFSLDDGTNKVYDLTSGTGGNKYILSLKGI